MILRYDGPGPAGVWTWKVAENDSPDNSQQLNLQSTHFGPLKKATALRYSTVTVRVWCFKKKNESLLRQIIYITAPCIMGNSRQGLRFCSESASHPGTFGTVQILLLSAERKQHFEIL